MPINAAVIGVGVMGRNHARVYSQFPNVRLAAIADVNSRIGKAVAEKFDCRFYEDYQLMLRKERIECLSVAVPTSLHAEVSSKWYLLVSVPTRYNCSRLTIRSDLIKLAPAEPPAPVMRILLDIAVINSIT